MTFGKLLIVDDDLMTCELLATAAEPMFDDIRMYTNAAEFLQEPLREHDVILLDLQMPHIDGVETLRRLAAKDCPSAIMLMSGYDESVLSSAQSLAEGLGLKVEVNLAKPIAIATLMESLNAVVQKYCLEADNDKAFDVTDASSFCPSEAELAYAIDNHHLVLHFQPQVCFNTHTLVGLEALVRWRHPIYGLIYPDRFIELAESCGLIGRLTEEVISLAVQQSRFWHDNGYAFKLSVNVSAQNITNLETPELLETLVKKNRLDPRMFVLEITESGLMQEITTSLDILTRLRLKGFGLSIDDFGTGFSSLSLLHRVPFTELKIDQSFVMKMLDDPQCGAIVETCIMLGHKLRMSVVAEGVENHKIFRQLRALGCDIAQGYQVAKPLASEELIDWYKGLIRMRGMNVMSTVAS